MFAVSFQTTKVQKSSDNGERAGRESGLQLFEKADIHFCNAGLGEAFHHTVVQCCAVGSLLGSPKKTFGKVGKDGSMIKSGDEYHFIEAWPADTIDATGAGDTYAAGFLYAHSLGLPLEICGDAGSIIAAKVVEVIGTKIDIPRWKVAKRELRELIASAEKK